MYFIIRNCKIHTKNTFKHQNMLEQIRLILHGKNGFVESSKIILMIQQNYFPI